MRLVWVPQWTVLPVIVEDREMFDENVQRGRLPGLGQPMESLTRNRLNDNEGALLPRQSCSIPSHGVSIGPGFPHHF